MSIQEDLTEVPFEEGPLEAQDAAINKDRPDTGKMNIFDQFFNLDDNILSALDDKTINEIMMELDRVMKGAGVAPGVPLEMSLPMIRDIFAQILYQKTGLAPAPMGM